MDGKKVGVTTWAGLSWVQVESGSVTGLGGSFRGSDRDFRNIDRRCLVGRTRQL